MASGIANNLYTVDPATQFYSVDLSKVTTAEIRKEAAAQVTYDARVEVLKAAALYAIAIGATLAVATVTVVAFKIGAFVIGLFTFPLAVIPPLYSLATSLGGIAIGGGVGYAMFQKYVSHFIEEANQHWNHAQHLYGQKSTLNSLQIN